jgi:transposase InsO family protein
MDICGPLPESKLGRHKYAMILVDDSTRFKMGLALRSRDEAGAHIRRFISRFNSLAAHSQGRISKVGTLLTDGAREFLSHAVQHLLDEHGVNKIEAPPEVHALNGVAERAILSIFTQVRAHLEQSNAPKGFWPEAMAHSIDVLNRVTGATPRPLQLVRRSDYGAATHNEHPTVGLPRLGADASTHTLETRRQCTGGYQSRALGEATREFPHLDPTTAPHS